jgi:hypothetical protein
MATLNNEENIAKPGEGTSNDKAYWTIFVNASPS